MDVASVCMSYVFWVRGTPAYVPPSPPLPPQGVLTASSIVGTCGLAWSVGLPGRARLVVNAFAAMSLVQVGGAGVWQVEGWMHGTQGTRLHPSYMCVGWHADDMHAAGV